MMAAHSSPETMLFDLDNTLFDHQHSLSSALTAVQREYPDLGAYDIAVLIDTYNSALETAYNQYLNKSISHADIDGIKIQSFFEALHLPKPSPSEVVAFRTVYKPAYRESRRATVGSIETLTRLRHHGSRTAIVTNGQTKDQVAKAEAIGVASLVDHIVTSEEAGHPKPDIRIFQKALEMIGGTPSTAYMVGDNVESDIKGALEAGLTPILYSPVSAHTDFHLFGKRVPVIRHMSELLDHLYIALPE